MKVHRASYIFLYPYFVSVFPTIESNEMINVFVFSIILNSRYLVQSVKRNFTHRKI